LKEVGETSQITSKTTSKPYDKRELTLVDDTGYSVRLTVWGKVAAGFDISPESIVAFKGVKVSDFGGRSLSLLSSGSMSANPDMPEAHKLKGWFDDRGRSDNFSTHAGVQGAVSGGASRRDPFKTISQIKEEQLGMSENPDFFSVKASIQYIKQDNFCYPACQEEGCNKKVIETDPGQWRCERHDKTFDKPQYRYIMSVNISDHTGQLWVSCFDETGRMVVGMSADELMEIKEVDEKRLAEIISDANCKTWNWKCKAKLDSFQEQQR
jgi:replication factor A1